MKKKKNYGFTLTELVVVMAVSSIFLGMVMVILASSLNLFNKNEKQSNIFSDTTVIDNMFSVFIEDVNKNGEELFFDLENEKIYYLDGYIDIDDNINTVYLKIEKDDENKRDEKKEYSGISINIEVVDDFNFVVIYKNDEKVIKNTVYKVLGGIQNE